jgi:virginiamycin B lyase
MTTDGVVSHYPLADGVEAFALTVGADGNIWFGYRDGIGKMTPAGVATYYPITTPEVRDVVDIESGPDGNVWFVQFPLDRVGRITPDGVVTFFPTSDEFRPVSIARGGDGGLWLAFQEGGAVARLAMNGTIEPLYPMGPGAWSDGRPNAVFHGPDAQIWFTVSLHARIGRISTDGQVELIDFSSNISVVEMLAAGPDGNLWADVSERCTCCISECPPPTQPPISIARVNLVAQATDSIPTMSDTALGLLVVALAALATTMLKGVGSGGH